jgi:hypothetical protein
MRSHRLMLAGLALAACMAPAAAHHGWGVYDTGTALYLEGTIVEVRWTNPHPQVVLELAARPPAADPAKVPVPPELEQFGFAAVLSRAVPPSRGGRFTLDLAPTGRLAAWGLDAAPRTGQRWIAVAYPSCTTPGVVRPAVVVLADGRAVRQQSVPLPAGCSAAPRG